MSPRSSRSILPASLSTQVTETPNSEKQAPETKPTYPVPTTATRMRYPEFQKNPLYETNSLEFYLPACLAIIQRDRIFYAPACPSYGASFLMSTTREAAIAGLAVKY